MAFVKRIVALGSDGATTIYKGKKKKRKKRSRAARPWDRMTRRILKAQKTYTNELVRRHDRSNRQRRDGGLRDFSYNLSRANEKALRRLIR